MFLRVRIILFLIVFISLVVLVGCPGVADYSIDLPENLKVSRNSANDFVIVSTDSVGIGTTIVPAQIMQIGWDDHYVIAKQMEGEQEFYWIIEVKTEEVIGPLNDNDFAQNKIEWPILAEIQLKDLDEYEKDYGF